MSTLLRCDAAETETRVSVSELSGVFLFWSVLMRGHLTDSKSGRD